MRVLPRVAQVCEFERKWIGYPICYRANIEVAQVQHELTDPFRDFSFNLSFRVS